MSLLADNAAIIRYRGVLEPSEEKRQVNTKLRLLLGMSVTHTLTGYWMVRVCVCVISVTEQNEKEDMEGVAVILVLKMNIAEKSSQ